MSVASLPMYDLPELRWATDALWKALARALELRGIVDVPAVLERQRPLQDVWLDPTLLLSQTCGYPLRQHLNHLHPRVQVVATPRYRATHCEGALYRSVIVVSAASRLRTLSDLRGRTFAANERTSHSGMNAPRAAFAPLGRGGRCFSAVRFTGSHRASLQLVAAGEVDATAVDCVTFALLERVDPELTGCLRVIDVTPSCPGLPLITAGGRSAAELTSLREALNEVWRDPRLAEVRAALLLDGFEVLHAEAYRRVDELEAEAIGHGYPQLA